MSEDEFVLFDTEMNPPSWETGSNSSFNRMFGDLSDEDMTSGEEGSTHWNIHRARQRWSFLIILKAKKKL
jgi:hypothetical protein